jgi:hypothetical protein
MVESGIEDSNRADTIIYPLGVLAAGTNNQSDCGWLLLTA